MGSGKCPVVLWLHDGSFQTSDGGPKQYGPKLIMDYNVIMVSINYRLGPLGFLSLESEVVPGNFGLWDQRMALEWVRREASNFCGDPSRVSLMGQGAGSESAIYQLLTPANQNNSDIYAIIAQSGSPVGDPMLKLNHPKENAIKLAAKLGCKTDVRIFTDILKEFILKLLYTIQIQMTVPIPTHTVRDIVCWERSKDIILGTVTPSL